MRLQPLFIRFDEPVSPRPNNDVKATMDDKELALAYIQDVVKSSDLNWEELLARSFYSEQLLEQALMDDIDFCSTHFCNDKKLLFDCINEVLVEFCGHAPLDSLSVTVISPTVCSGSKSWVGLSILGWYPESGANNESDQSSKCVTSSLLIYSLDSNRNI